MNTSLLVRSLPLAVALLVPAFTSASDDIVTLDSIIGGTRTASFHIKVGMDQRQVRDALGEPEVVVGKNLWGYVNVTWHDYPPGERYDALVIFMIDGRVRLLRLTKRTAVFDLVARFNPAGSRPQSSQIRNRDKRELGGTSSTVLRAKPLTHQPEAVAPRDSPPIATR